MDSIFDTEKFRLGSLCKRGHNFNGTGQSLRYKIGSTCVECRVINHKAEYEANRDEIKKRSRDYHQANRERILEVNRSYYYANRDWLNEKRKIRYRSNPEMFREIGRIYYAKLAESPDFLEKERERQKTAREKNPELHCEKKEDLLQKICFKSCKPS
ncbi:MAG TPA: hypothetical protein V6D12_13685 [Candidatus Obscuribacterales bacterium]